MNATRPRPNLPTRLARVVFMTLLGLVAAGVWTARPVEAAAITAGLSASGAHLSFGLSAPTDMAQVQ